MNSIKSFSAGLISTFLLVFGFISSVKGQGTSQLVSFKTHNGQYVCAENGGGQEVVANRNERKEWETFILIDKNGGQLESGDVVNIASYNNHFMVAENGGGGTVNANRDAAREWEEFVIIKTNGNGVITSGDSIALKTHNGQYVCAENGGGQGVVADRNERKEWETFKIEFVTPSPKNQFPINVKRDDFFGGFDMSTKITISKNGRFDAVTDIRNKVALKGNCGTVTVWLLDKDGNVLSRHGGQQYCTDGTLIPGAPSFRSIPWEFTISPDVLQQVTGVSIMHGEGSKNFFDLIEGHINRAKQVVLSVTH